MMVTFEKNTTDLQEFQYVLPKITDIEGHSFKMKVNGLQDSFMEFENNTFIFRVSDEEGSFPIKIDLVDEHGS